MPPKSSSNKKKQSAVLWYYCAKCEAHITHKARENHEGDHCPIEKNKEDNGKRPVTMDYIRNGILHTSIVERRGFSIEALENLSQRHLNNLLFVSEEALRLLEWKIGQYVIVEGSGHPGAPLIRSLWPIPAKFLTTILVNEDDFELYWSNFKRGENSVSIRSLLPERIGIAEYVSFQFMPDNPFEHPYLQQDENLNKQILRDVCKILKQQIKDFYVMEGTHIYLDFFNQSLLLKVEELRGKGSIKMTASLEEQMKAVSLTENENVLRAAQIDVNTILEILSKEEDPKSEAMSGRENIDHCSTFVDFQDIGGLSKQIEAIKEAIDLAMGYSSRRIPKGLRISRGLLLYGPTGCGKTMICDAISHYFSTKTLEHQQKKSVILQLNSSEVFSKFLGEAEKNLSDYFSQVFNNYPRPTLIIIEDIHMLCPRQESNAHDLSKRISAAFVRLIDSLNKKPEGGKCFILGTTCHLDLLNVGLRRCGRFDIEIEIPVPNQRARFEILQCIFKKMCVGKDYNITYQEIQEISEITHGFVGADLMQLVQQSYLHALRSKSQENNDVETHEDTPIIRLDNVRGALSQVNPSAMREVLIDSPNVRWCEIGGVDECKFKLQQAIEWPLKHSKHYQRLGIKAPRGILLYGPPGCSKTMIAKALATESSLNFISIKGPELFSMWVGESERAVRDVFRKARQVAPAIVFFDEIDAIGGERFSDSSGEANGKKGGGDSVQERVLTQLLTELDGVEPLENVFILAATNRPDLIDTALLRPGRIDRILYIGLPDTEARKKIFQIKLHEMPTALDVCLDELVTYTEGYSGAEIQAICQEAALNALAEDLCCTHVNMSHFLEAIKTIRPRTNKKLLDIYEKFKFK